MTNKLYITLAFLEQLFSLINSQNVDIAYSNKLLKKLRLYSKFSFST